MLIGHVSDLHLRDGDDVVAFARQLDRIAAIAPAHLAITGDLLDRWQPSLLESALDALAARGFMHAERLTILHGNHDLASSGGHPRRRSDLWRLGLRFWDPPPLIQVRKRRFYQAIARRADGVAQSAPFAKTLASGVRIAVLDTVPVPWRPLRFDGRSVVVQHAVGCLRGAEIEWLGTISAGAPLVVLLHHYPLGAPQFQWTPPGRTRRVVQEVQVPMGIPAEQRARFWEAAAGAAVRLVLCGHVHRARLDWQHGTAVGLNGQSGAAWAGRTIAYYDLSADGVRMSLSDERQNM